MIISLANSIRFWSDDNDLANFDNRAYQDGRNFNFSAHDYIQKYYNDDIITIQVKQINGSPAPTATAYKEDLTTESITVNLINSYTEFDIYEFSIDFSDFSIPFRVVVTDGTEMYRSEILETIDPSNELLLIQWNNTENAFEIDYSTEIVHSLRVESVLRLSSPGGEQSIYDNMEETVKLRDQVKRVMKLSVKEIPEQLCEKLRIAIAHDQFYVNGIQYTADGLPEYSEGELTNLYEFSCDLTQRNVVGLNSHDIGMPEEGGEFEEVDPIAMLAIGDRTYTEQNYITDEEEITTSLDELDKALYNKSDSDHRHDDLYDAAGEAESVIGDHEVAFDHDKIGTALQDITAGLNITIDKDDPTNPVIHAALTTDGNADIQLEGVRVISSGWVFDDPLYSYELTVAPLLDGYTAHLTVQNEYVDIVVAAQLLPEADCEAGKVIMYAVNQPTGDFYVNIIVRLNADLESYITEEEDPVFVAHPAYTITAQDIIDWNAKWNIPGTGARASATDAGIWKETSMDDDFLYICTYGGAAGYAKWKKILLLET